MSDAVYGAHQSSSEAGQLLATFWPRVMHDVRNKPLQTQKAGSRKDEPIQELPLARIKKIMKQDGEVKMISAEAPILFSKAAEIFVSELSLRAWIHTEDNKRRTLQRNDIAMAITKYDQFDFLIDIVPRDELKPAKRQEEVIRQPPNVMAPEQVQYYFQLSQLQQQSGATASQPATASTPQITQLPPGAQIIQQPNGQIVIAAQAHQIAALTGNATNAQQPTQIIQIPAQDATPSASETQHVSNTEQQLAQASSVSQPSGQFTASGQQLHYVRIPQSALQQSGGASNLSQVMQLQQQQQQQTSQHQQQVSSTESQNNGSETRQQESSYSQIYQQLPSGLPAGTVYVMSSSQVPNENVQE